MHPQGSTGDQRPVWCIIRVHGALFAPLLVCASSQACRKDQVNQEDPMYAVIETGGKQYRVAPGDTIRVESIHADIGAVVEFGGLLLATNDNGDVLTGGDISHAKVVATISGQGRGDKVIAFKFKRKKQYKKTIGHRQNYTQLT